MDRAECGSAPRPRAEHSDAGFDPGTDQRAAHRRALLEVIQDPCKGALPMKSKNLTMPKQVMPDPDNNDGYGKFVIEPLERGFGLTLGNALRRVLLSSLQGAAITAVRIDGVLHEFSTLPGVIEDVTEIILNLKQVRLKLHGDGPKKGVFEIRGKGEVRAGNLQVDTEIEVLNPDLHIATLTRDGDFRMEVE